MATVPTTADAEKAVLDIYKKFGTRPGEALMIQNLIHSWDSIRFRMDDLNTALASLGEADALYMEDGKPNFIFLSESGYARITGVHRIPKIGDLDMPLSDLANDNVELLKQDGSRVPGLKASVQKAKIFMEAGKTLVEPATSSCERCPMVQRKLIRSLTRASMKNFQVWKLTTRWM